MTNNAAAVFNESFELLDEIRCSNQRSASAREHWQSMRPKPGPQPRQRRTAQQINQQRQQEWVSWIDNRIGERLDAHADSYDHAVGEAIAAFTVPKFRTLQSQIRELRGEL